MQFEIYRGPEAIGRWCWRLRDDTQRIIALGEGYRTKAECYQAIELVRGTSSLTPVLDDAGT